MKVKNDHRSKFFNWSNWKKAAWKIRASTGFEPVTSANTGAMLYQLSYEATHWERGQFIELISSFFFRSSFFTSMYNCHCHVPFLHHLGLDQLRWTRRPWKTARIGKLSWKMNAKGSEWINLNFAVFFSFTRPLKIRAYVEPTINIKLLAKRKIWSKGYFLQVSS